jgi:hypothetical protein
VIATAVSKVARELNLAMRNRTDSTEDLVVVSNLLEIDGTPAPQAVERVAVFLVNIEREAAPPRHPTLADSGRSRVGLVQPPIFLNLMVLFAANFSGTKYPEALKAISSVAAFFQARPVFDHQTTPDLDPAIERLTLEIENLTIADLGNLWGVLGGRYVPSLLYRMRMVVIDASRLEDQVPRVTRPELELVPGGGA